MCCARFQLQLNGPLKSRAIIKSISSEELMTSQRTKKSSGGFSLLELIIAMAITITLMTAASTLLAGALRVRSRENQKSDALADTQRALNILTREIADSGFNLNNNGIVASDSTLHTLRIRSNLNKYDLTASVIAQNGIGLAPEDAGEDISYYTNLAEIGRAHV